MKSIEGLASIVIAVDGPSGAGKSTVSKAVAEKLGLVYIDTGAMYRAVALKAKRAKVPFKDDKMLEGIAKGCSISFKKVDDDNRTILDGEDVSEAIRTPEISLFTSRVSAVPGVRKALVVLQRAMGKTGGVIMDGRDVGTVIFPDTPFKFFIDASLEIRGKRRHLELKEKGADIADETSTIKEMAERDDVDSSREESPLVRADDAVYIDTSPMTQEEVAVQIGQLVCEILEKEGRA
ncbi:MAG: (d)CMP kinase [Proteobacteria bacterium]|nr:(d)CMP kinase [Pseudomonadota bacterium]